MVEAPAKMRGDLRLGGHLRPVEQQIVVIEHVLRLLGLDIAGEQLLQLFGPARAPGKHRTQNFAERRLRIDGARIDRKTGALGRKAGFGLRQSELVPDEVHQVGGILAVVDGEGGIEANLQRIVAQQPGADAVKRAGPAQRVGDDGSIAAQHLARDALDPLRHFRRGAARKGHQQDAPRIGALDDEMRDAVRQRVGLAGTGAGDHQQGPSHLAVAMLDSLTLLVVELRQIGGLGGPFPKGRIRGGKVHRPSSIVSALFATASSSDPRRIATARQR